MLLCSVQRCARRMSGSSCAGKQEQFGPVPTRCRMVICQTGMSRSLFLTCERVEAVVSFANQCEKEIMNSITGPSAKLRQAFFAWTIGLTLALVWIGSQLRSSEFPTFSASVGFASMQAPDHVAKLSATGKIHRSPDIRHGSDPDLLYLAAGTAKEAVRIVRDAPSCATGSPPRAERLTIPEPRGPPLT